LGYLTPDLDLARLHRVLRVARTIADLDGVPQIRSAHIAEALSFRRIAPERR
jgi:magnesium chelatase family protein